MVTALTSTGTLQTGRPLFESYQVLCLKMMFESSALLFILKHLRVKNLSSEHYNCNKFVYYLKHPDAYIWLRVRK